jgi:hypothetical protein
MPWADLEQNGGFIQPFAVGPVMQAVPVPQNPPAGTIAANGTLDLGLMPSDGYKVLAIGVTLSNAGSIVVQRYIDANGTVPQGAAVTGALVAATAGILNVTDVTNGLAYLVSVNLLTQARATTIGAP